MARRPRTVSLILLRAFILVCLTIELPFAHGRKCVCTSKACLAAGLDTCRTRFFCYTEFILVENGQGNTTTRGCTEHATPLSCKIRPRSTAIEINDTSMDHPRIPLPRLIVRCCDSHDYCNSAVVPDPEVHRYHQQHRPASTLSLQNDPMVSQTGTQVKPSDPPDLYHDKKSLDSSSSASTTTSLCGNGLNSSSTQQQVKPMHIAALVLTVAALISVFAACYVITSFLRSHPARPAASGTTACKCSRSHNQPFRNEHQDFEFNVINELQKSPQCVGPAFNSGLEL